VATRSRYVWQPQERLGTPSSVVTLISNVYVVVRALIAYENILRFSQVCLRSTLTGHFQSCENEKNAQLTACYSLFPSKSKWRQ